MGTQEPRPQRRNWRRTGTAILENPTFNRAVLVTGVVSGVFLALGLARGLGYIDPRLWNLLELPVSEGAANTLKFSLTIIPIGAVIGFIMGWARVTRHPILSWPASVYVDIVRGTPALVMILFAFFWLPFVLRSRDPSAGLTYAVLALAIHTSAYQAEIFRAGFQSVPRGQIDAAEAIGLNRWQAMRHVVLPQTFRVTLPALGNEFAVIIKDTSLLAAIGALELVYWGRESAQYALSLGSIGWVISVWLVIALLYFVITYVITNMVGAVEHAFRVPGLGSVAF